MSRLLKRVAFETSQASLYGFVPISALYRFYYKPLGIAFIPLVFIIQSFLEFSHPQDS